jgi:HNH endonuclease
VENLMRARAEVGRKISLRGFSGPEAVWQTTEEAKKLFQQIKAHQVKSQICNQRSGQLTEKGDRSMRASFMKLFTTSKMGLGIKDTGASKRDGKLQTDFRKEMIKVYRSQHKSEDLLWCPIVGKWTNPKDMKAAHLFAHGQDTMDAIFGETKTPELFSPKNGLLISSWIEDIFDSGKLVLVPD